MKGCLSHFRSDLTCISLHFVFFFHESLDTEYLPRVSRSARFTVKQFFKFLLFSRTKCPHIADSEDHIFDFKDL